MKEALGQLGSDWIKGLGIRSAILQRCSKTGDIRVKQWAQRLDFIQVNLIDDRNPCQADPANSP